MEERVRNRERKTVLNLLRILTLLLAWRINLNNMLLQITSMFVAQRRRSLHVSHRHRIRALRLTALRKSRKSRIVWSHPRSMHWWDVIVPGFNPTQFIQNFRVSRASFEYICQRLSPVLQRSNTNFRLCVPVEKRVAIAIWKFATNIEYSTVSRLFGVGNSTVCQCVQEVCNAVINVLLPIHIAFPNAEKFMDMAEFFNNQWGVPQCVGVIKGSHVPILAPEEFASDYFNDKGWHSIFLQGTVDGKGQFWDVCVGFPGSVHTAKVLQQSDLWDRLQDGNLLGQHKITIAGHDVGHYLIGDPAYPLLKWLLKPFADTELLAHPHQRFNSKISSMSSVAEAAFGRLKGRWRCLLKRNDCKLELTKKMALACCVLHNICEEHGDAFLDELPDMHADLQPPTSSVPSEEAHAEGIAVQAALMDYFNRQGE
nr:protein ANTAGONIST OF LIKE HETEROCHROMATIN PROTEIN 1-like [Paramormyrops kingsleyae]